MKKSKRYKLLKYPNSKLRCVSAEVPKNANISKICKGMTKIILQHGGVGLAAPQIGALYRIILVHEPDKKPFFLINPRILEYSEEKEMCKEGCLSFPGMFDEVERSKQITIECEDENREIRRYVSYGLEAQIIQHECEHLDGILFIDHLNN